MRGIEDAVLALAKFVEAGHVGRHFTVRRNDHCRRPAHNMIAGHQSVVDGEAEMVGGMPRCRYRDDTEPLDIHAVAVLEDAVWRVGAVERGISARAYRLQRERGAADDRRAGHVRKRPRRRAVITMRVRAHDRRDAASADRPDQSLDMFGKIGPGIDDGDLALTDQVGLGPVIGERRRIAREHASDSRLDRFQEFVRSIHALTHARLAAPIKSPTAAAGARRSPHRPGRSSRSPVPKE